MIFGTCIFVMNDNDGTILSVSRKDDKNDIGLPGGKVEPGETPLGAALRELFEETGYEVNDPRFCRLIYHAESDGKLAVTYEIPFSSLKQTKMPSEAGVVAWVKPEILASSKTFGEYNTGLLKSCGIPIGKSSLSWK